MNNDSGISFIFFLVGGFVSFMDINYGGSDEDFIDFN